MKNIPQNIKVNKLFEINRIDQSYLVLFYALAWGLSPNFFGIKKTKKTQKQMIVNLSREFRNCANETGVTIAKSLSVEKCFDWFQRYGERSTPGYEFAMRFHILQFNLPKRFHHLYIPIVQETISQYKKGYQETARQIICGASLGGVM